MARVAPSIAAEDIRNYLAKWNKGFGLGHGNECVELDQPSSCPGVMPCIRRYYVLLGTMAKGEGCVIIRRRKLQVVETASHSH